MKFPIPSSLSLALALLTGCATTPVIRVPLTGDIMVDGPAMIANGPPQDKVLWQYRTAGAAMRRGNFELAKQLLDDALLTAGGNLQDKSARRARGYFHAESTKTFIGEPYERVMAYYYRGILYWMDGEPDNARACFRSAAIQDADAANHEYAADYVLLDYLDGLATEKLSGDGADALQRAQEHARLVKPGAYQSKANVLFFVEFGVGPHKYATGEFGQELRFGLRPSPVYSAEIAVNGRTIPAYPHDDLHFQATTRGGRAMDHILANKAVFKQTTDVASDAAIISGAIAASHNDRTAQQVGLGLVAAGVITKIVSAASTPEADTREWAGLPRYLSFAATTLPPGEHTAKVDFRDANGNLLPGLTRNVTVTVPSDGRDAVVFISDQSSTPQTS